MRRTDLALEARELWREKSSSALPPGAEGETLWEGGCTLETLVVAAPEAARALGKPMGKYVTVTPGTDVTVSGTVAWTSDGTDDHAKRDELCL